MVRTWAEKEMRNLIRSELVFYLFSSMEVDLKDR